MSIKENFILIDSQTLYLFAAADYEHTNGLADVQAAIQCSAELKQLIAREVKIEISEREEYRSRSSKEDISSRCSSYYLLSNKLNWTSMILFYQTEGKIEGKEVMKKPNEYIKPGLDDEIADEKLVEQLYKDAMCQIDFDAIISTISKLD